MEKWKIVGYKRCDFESRDKQQIKGWTLYLAREPVSKGLVGLEVVKIFIGDALGYTPVENETVFISYNRYGRVASISKEV